MAREERGGKMGPKIALLVSQSIVHTHQRLLGTKHKLAMHIFHGISNVISDEVDDTLGPVLKKMAANYDANGPLSAYMDFMAKGQGQWKAIVGSSASASGILWALSTIMNNELAPLTYGDIASNPHLIPDVASIAGLAATGRWDENDALLNIRKQGMNNAWGEALIDAQRVFPTPADALDIRRRGGMNDDAFLVAMERNGYSQDIAAAFLRMLDLPLSPADAALAVLRNNMALQDGIAVSAQSGVSERDFRTMIDNTGEPLSLTDLMEAFRRGYIDEARVREGIRQSRPRDEGSDTAMKLAYSPMTVSDAVRAVVQNQMPMDEGQRIARENGLQDGMFQILYNTDGNPLSRTEMEDLYNRGKVTEDEVKQAIRESRVKNKYVDLAFDLHVKLIEPRQLSAAVRYGTISHDDAVHRAMQHGYSQADAIALVGAGSAAKLQSYKDRVVGQIETMYLDSAISRETAANLIIGMGYEAHEVEFILQASDYHRESRAVSAALNVVRAKYVGRHIDKGTASNAMDGIGVPTDQRDYLLKLWDVEVSTNVRVLTPAQVVKGVKDGVIQPDDGLARLVFIGYSEADAVLLIGGL